MMFIEHTISFIQMCCNKIWKKIDLILEKNSHVFPLKHQKYYKNIKKIYYRKKNELNAFFFNQLTLAGLP